MFTEKEIAYLRGQTLGRLATVGPDGSPHNVPVGFRLDAEHGTVEITGRRLAASRKYRDVRAGRPVAFVVDDVPTTDPPMPRGIEIRGTAQTLESDSGPLIRIHPTRIVTWGIEADWTAGTRGRDVPATAVRADTSVITGARPGGPGASGTTQEAHA